MIGKTLAHYEITSLLGKGGMGEVYHSRDTKLGRDVAIKVLPDEFARDADRVARFEREARLLASLNHPNIAAIYGLEESGGTNFLVMEFIEGQTLADRIKTGPISVEEALNLAVQIAEALEAAHEKGIIHRDLKPANIKITPEERVKILDFGLAKAFAEDQGEMKPLDSPTLSAEATRQGVILGTAAYMSPEQARGRPVDKRADIWAFGVVLYEMLTGKSLFAGEDVTSTLARVLERQPDYSELTPDLHPRIRFLLERCLEKEARNRYGSISDTRVEIQKAISDPGGAFQSIPEVMHRKTLRVGLPWLAAALVLGAIIAGTAIWKFKPSEHRLVMQFEYDLPEGQELTGLAVSPDGRQFIYGTPRGFYVRSLGQLTPRLIPGTEGDNQDPRYSPDGKWISYFSAKDKKLKKISINGGDPSILCEITAQYLNASWDEDDKILYSEMGKGILQVSANGGTPEIIFKLKPGFLAYYAPQLLPDRKSVLCTAVASNNQRIITILSLESGKAKELFAGYLASYLPTGHIAYGSLADNSAVNIFAVPFDLNKQEAGGSVLLLEGVNGGAYSNTGTLVYTTAPQAPSEETPVRTLVWVDIEGREETRGLPAIPDNYKFPEISPDGTQVALTKSQSTSDQQVWIWDSVREIMTRLTLDKSPNYRPIWTRDGKRIIFISYRDSRFGIYWKAADGTDEDRELVSASSPTRMMDPWSWSADGNTLVLDVIELASNPTHGDICTLSMDSGHAVEMLLSAEYNQLHPSTSPDGKYIAYMSGESGNALEIYVRPFPDVNNGKWQISTGGGESPLWSPDSRELFYRNGAAVMAVSIDTKPAFSPGKPRMLFQGPYATGYQESPAWDISPDGKRFLMIKQPTGPNPASTTTGPKKIIVVVNWFEELKKRVPAD